MRLPFWADYCWGRNDRDRARLKELLEAGFILPPPAVSGGSRNFDAVDDHINRGVDDASLDVADGDSFIVQALAKLDAVGSANRQIAGKKRSNSSAHIGYAIFMASTEVVGAYVSDGTDALNVGTQTMVAGTWYAMAAVLKAVAAADDDISFYVDGGLQAGPTNSTLMGTLVNGIDFKFGSGGLLGGTGFLWDGDGAYCRAYRKAGAAWTDQEIADIVANWRFLALPAPVPYLGLAWMFGETDAAPTTTPDLSGNGLTGTYVGTTDVANPSGSRMAGRSRHSTR